MRTVLTLLMLLFAISASAQTLSPQEELSKPDSVAVAAKADSVAVATTKQDSVTVATTKQDSVVVATAKPEASTTEAPKEGGEEVAEPVVNTKATIQIHAHGDADAIIKNTLYSGSKKVKAYRIMIYVGNSPSARGEAGAARSQFMKLFPGHPTYMFYENPYFKVTVGNYFTIEEAQMKLERVRKYFEKAFIVHETVSVYEFAK